MNPLHVSVRAMVLTDLERVMEIAESLKEAPHWPQASYLAALEPEGAPRRIALVACKTGATSGATGQAAEKRLILDENHEKHPSGAKARIDSIDLTYGLKPVPFTTSSFSAACKAPSFWRDYVRAEARTLQLPMEFRCVCPGAQSRGRTDSDRSTVALPLM